MGSDGPFRGLWWRLDRFVAKELPWNKVESVGRLASGSEDEGGDGASCTVMTQVICDRRSRMAIGAMVGARFPICQIYY